MVTMSPANHEEEISEIFTNGFQVFTTIETGKNVSG
jgi:hypothetical protein